MPGDDASVGVGGNVDDLCRACKILRRHTVMAMGADGAIARVVCDYCGSHHNYRGGEKAVRTVTPRAPRPLERSPSVMDQTEFGKPEDLEGLLRRVIREETGMSPTAPAQKWSGGELVLRPGQPGLQEKVWPIDKFFVKVVMLRNRLRTLEQQLNAADLPEPLKLKLQSYITGCYGTLTSFNVLFADEEDRFRGAGGKD